MHTTTNTPFIQGQQRRPRTVSCAWHSVKGDEATVATHNVYIPERGLIWPACPAHAEAARPSWKVTTR